MVGNVSLFVNAHGTKSYLPVFKVYRDEVILCSLGGTAIVDRAVCDEYVSYPQGGAAIVPARAGEYQGEGGR